MNKSLLPKDVQHRIAEQATDRTIAAIVSRQDIVDASDISNIRSDIDALIDSYIDHPENPNDDTIADKFEEPDIGEY